MLPASRELCRLCKVFTWTINKSWSSIATIQVQFNSDRRQTTARVALKLAKLRSIKRFSAQFFLCHGLSRTLRVHATLNPNFKLSEKWFSGSHPNIDNKKQKPLAVRQLKFNPILTRRYSSRLSISMPSTMFCVSRQRFVLSVSHQFWKSLSFAQIKELSDKRTRLGREEGKVKPTNRAKKKEEKTRHKESLRVFAYVSRTRRRSSLSNKQFTINFFYMSV